MARAVCPPAAGPLEDAACFDEFLTKLQIAADLIARRLLPAWSAGR